jgi:hypothetical protein
MQDRHKRGLRSLPFKFGSSAAHNAAEGMAKHLNGRRGAVGFARVEAVINALNQIDRVVRSEKYPSNAYAGIYKGKFGGQTMKLKRVVDDFMREVRLVVALGEPREEGWDLVQVVSPVHPPASERGIYLDALLIFNSATHGDVCGRWFVRTREDHRFCEPACREKAFRSSEEGRAKRAKFMRAYRAGLKRRDSENLKACGRMKG